MAEILVKAIDAVLPDATQDREASYKRGMPVVVAEDGHKWGQLEKLPAFIVLKFPLVPKIRLLKYIQPELGAVNEDGFPVIFRRRIWQLSWNELPPAAKQTILDTGGLVIKARDAYAGPYDYTWEQVKAFLKRVTSGLSETEAP